MRTRLTSVISLLMATILVLGALFTSCAPEKKESQVAKYLNKILEATFAGLDEGEPQITTSKLTFNNTADLNIPLFQNAEMTFITGTGGESVCFADVNLEGGKFDLSVYNAGLSVIVGSSILGPNKYGFQLTDMTSIISLFTGYFMPTQPAPEQNNAANNNTATAAPESSATGLGNLFGSLEGINSLLDGKNPEKVYGLLEKYAKIIANAADGACRSKIQTGDAVSVSIEFNTDSAKKLIKDVFASLKKDKDLKSIVESVLVTSGIPKEEAKAQLDAIFSDEMARSIYDMLDAAPFEFKAEVTADKDYVLNGISVEFKSQGATYKIFFDGTEAGKTVFGMINTVSAEGIFHRQENKIELVNKTENGAEIFEINSISIVDNKAHAQPILKLQSEGENFSLTLHLNDDVEGPWSLTLAGTVTTAGNKSTVTIKSATAYGNTLNVDLTVVSEIGGTLPEFPTNFKNILDLTGNEINAIIDNIENSPLGQLMPKDESEIVLPDVDY